MVLYLLSAQRHHILNSAGNIASPVNIMVVCGVIDGNTVCSYSWTRPPVIDASVLVTFIPNLGTEKKNTLIKTCINKPNLAQYKIVITRHQFSCL